MLPTSEPRPACSKLRKNAKIILGCVSKICITDQTKLCSGHLSFPCSGVPGVLPLSQRHDGHGALGHAEKNDGPLQEFLLQWLGLLMPDGQARPLEGLSLNSLSQTWPMHHLWSALEALCDGLERTSPQQSVSRACNYFLRLRSSPDTIQGS